MKHSDETESLDQHLEHCEECRAIADLPYDHEDSDKIPLTVRQAHKAMEFYEDGLEAISEHPEDLPRIVHNSVMVGCIGRAVEMDDEKFLEFLREVDTISRLGERLLRAYDQLVLIAQIRQARLS